MDGLGALDRAVQAALRRDRLLVLSSLAAVVALAWLYLWHHSAMGMAVSPAEAAGLPALVLAFAMWLIMMAAMMLPSAAPATLLYAAMVRGNPKRGHALGATWIFVSGYLLAWAGFSLAAALLQAALVQALLLSPTLVSSSAALSGTLLVAAGLYQLTPLKARCLAACREPLPFFLAHWNLGALRMGLAHGAYCVGCCWMLMLLLFAVGVMNLAWVALIAALVFVEKLLPAGRHAGRFAGTALAALGLLVIGRGF